MSEHIISDEVLASIRKTCYEEGKRGAEVFTVRGPGEEIVRCCDCKWFRENATPNDPSGRYNFCTQFGFDFKGADGFCAWGERES